MSLGAGKIQRIARVQDVVLHFVEPKFTDAADYIDALFPVVVVRAATAGAGCDSEQMWLHRNLPSRKQFNAHAGLVGKLFALSRADQLTGPAGSSEE